MHLNQEYIEENFSQLMMDIKFNPAFNEYLDAFIEDLRIKPEEEMQRAILEKEKDELNQKLYEAVEDEIEENIKNLRKALALYTDERRDDLGYYLNAPEFQSELFERFIEKGTILDGSQIIYQFHSSFELWSPINYKAFQEQERRRKKAKSQLEKKEFLKGPEVKALLKYCEDPKKMTKMIDFLGKYASKNAFRKFILNPLIAQGKIKRTIPDKPGSKLQKYYSVKK
jgi:hypothetical protein